jgi:O-antigen/teichoic acid export membrane protein
MFNHILIYVPARLVPAAMSLLTLGIYTRVLTVDQYGYFALASAIAFMLDGFLGQWLMAAIMRFHARQATPADIQQLLASCGLLYLVPASLGCALVTVVVLYFGLPGAERLCLLLAAPYFFTFSLAQLVLRVRMAALDSGRFTCLLLAQSIAGAAVSIVLVTLVSAEPAAILFGLIVGFAVVLVLDWRTTGSFLAVGRADLSTIGEIVRFSWSGILAGGCSMLSSRLNRFLVLAYLGPGAVGLLNAAQSLTEQALSAVFMIVAMAAHPMTVRIQETGTTKALQNRLRSNAIWTFGLGLPSAVGFALLAPELASLFLGASYRETAWIIPWIAAAAVLNGLRSHFLVHSYFLANKLHYNLYLAAMSLVVMVASNSLLIPIFGLLGAVFALLITEFVATCFAVWLTRIAVPMPTPFLECGQLLLGVCVMAAAMLAVPGPTSAATLAAKIMVGGATYTAAVVLLNVNASRRKLADLIRSRLTQPAD